MSPLIALLAFFIASISSSGNSLELSSKLPGKFALPSGLVRYVVSGSATGTATFHFDRNGWRSIESRELVFEKYGLKSTEKKLTLIDGDYLYTINIDSNQGKKENIEEWSHLIKSKSRVETRKIIYESMGGQMMETDTLLGKPCEVWTFAKGPVVHLAIWKGLPLLIERKVPGVTYTLTAIEVLEAQQWSDDVFHLPEGIEWAP